jgi:hypothetical protein
MAVLVTNFGQRPLLYTIAMDAALVLVTQTILYIYWRQLKHSEHTRLHRHILLYSVLCIHEKAVTAWEPKMAVLVIHFGQRPLLYTIAMDAALVLVTQTMFQCCIPVCILCKIYVF